MSEKAMEERETIARSCARRFARFQKTGLSRDWVCCHTKSWLKLKIVCAFCSIFEPATAWRVSQVAIRCNGGGRVRVKFSDGARRGPGVFAIWIRDRGVCL